MKRIVRHGVQNRFRAWGVEVLTRKGFPPSLKMAFKGDARGFRRVGSVSPKPLNPKPLNTGILRPCSHAGLVSSELKVSRASGLGLKISGLGL